MYSKLLKRIIDFFISITAFLLLSPIIIAIAVLLAFGNNGNPFFTQNRPGKDGKLFRLIKFKTMNDEKDAYRKIIA